MEAERGVVGSAWFSLPDAPRRGAAQVLPIFSPVPGIGPDVWQSVPTESGGRKEGRTWERGAGTVSRKGMASLCDPLCSHLPPPSLSSPTWQILRCSVIRVHRVPKFPHVLFILPALPGMWDLSSRTRNQIRAACNGVSIT